MGKEYVINFDKFFETVTKVTEKEKNSETTITEIWQPLESGELTMVNKEVVENKLDLNEHMCTMRYDFLNGMLNNVLSTYMTPSGKIIKNVHEMPIGNRIIFDSLVKEGILEEKDRTISL